MESTTTTLCPCGGAFNENFLCPECKTFAPCPFERDIKCPVCDAILDTAECYTEKINAYTGSMSSSARYEHGLASPACRKDRAWWRGFTIGECRPRRAEQKP